VTNSKTSYRRAVSAAARELTHGLRKSALDHGWPNDAIRGIGVVHDGRSFRLHTAKSVESTVWAQEYGTETSRPTAAIRKFLNDSNKINEVAYRHYINQNRGH